MQMSMPRKDDRHHAGDLVGYWKNGRPIYLPGGGSTPPEPTVPPGTIPVVTPPPPPAPPQAITPDQLRDMQAQWQRDADERLAQQRAELEQSFSERLTPFEEERREREAEAQRLRDEAAEAERQRLASEETAAQRAERLQQETQAELQRMRDDLAARDAIIERERQFNTVQQYRAEQIQAHSNEIHPSQHRHIKGHTQQEIDASIVDAIAASNEIIEEAAALTQQQSGALEALRRAQPGASVTAPAAGPIEMGGTTRNLSAAEINDMSDADYAQHREQLLASAGAAYRQQNGYR